MMRCVAIFLAAAMVYVTLAQATDDQKLIDRAPGQGRGTTSGQTTTLPVVAPVSGSDELAEAERQAHAEANLALARLELIRGRKAMRDNDLREAARRAHRALTSLDRLPPDVDASDLGLQAEGILARASRAGINVEALARDAAADTPALEDDAELDRRVQGATRVARQHGGSERPDIDISGDARALRERTPDRHGYRPGREIIDVDAILAADEQRLVYQDALREAYKADEVRMLVEADEARLIPDGVISYPSDWPQRMAKRQQWAGGVIARSPSWYDKDGREWYVAIYDIHDLIFVPPDFIDPVTFGDFRVTLRDALDRQALRDHLFGGWGCDLDTAIPLLRYFGGVNPWMLPGPRYSLERQREVVEMIRAFTGGRIEEGEGTITSLPSGS